MVEQGHRRGEKWADLRQDALTTRRNAVKLHASAVGLVARRLGVKTHRVSGIRRHRHDHVAVKIDARLTHPSQGGQQSNTAALIERNLPHHIVRNGDGLRGSERCGRRLLRTLSA